MTHVLRTSAHRALSLGAHALEVSVTHSISDRQAQGPEQVGAPGVTRVLLHLGTCLCTNGPWAQEQDPKSDPLLKFALELRLTLRLPDTPPATAWCWALYFQRPLRPFLPALGFPSTAC